VPDSGTVDRFSKIFSIFSMARDSGERKRASAVNRLKVAAIALGPAAIAT